MIFIIIFPEHLPKMFIILLTVALSLKPTSSPVKLEENAYICSSKLYSMVFKHELWTLVPSSNGGHISVQAAANWNMFRCSRIRKNCQLSWLKNVFHEKWPHQSLLGLFRPSFHDMSICWFPSSHTGIQSMEVSWLVIRWHARRHCCDKTVVQRYTPNMAYGQDCSLHINV